MMNRAFLFLPFLLLPLLAPAQVDFGLRLGLSTTEVDPEAISVTSEGGLQNLLISVENANYGLHGGLYFRALMGKFYLQPELLLNTSSTDFSVQDLSGAEVVEDIRRETYRYLDIPFMMGFKFDAFRVQAGPVGHMFLSSTSELTDIEGYEQRFQEMTYGWQAGIGLDIWRLLIDLKYEGNFTKYGDHIRILGKDYDFDNRPGRFLLTLGFRITH